MNTTLILFQSTHQVIKAERLLLEASMSCQAVAVPKNISPECGIALRIDRRDIEAVQSLLAGNNLVFHFHDEQKEE